MWRLFWLDIKFDFFKEIESIATFFFQYHLEQDIALIIKAMWHWHMNNDQPLCDVASARGTTLAVYMDGCKTEQDRHLTAFVCWLGTKGQEEEAVPRHEVYKQLSQRSRPQSCVRRYALSHLFPFRGCRSGGQACRVAYGSDVPDMSKSQPIMNGTRKTPCELVCNMSYFQSIQKTFL